MTTCRVDEVDAVDSKPSGVSELLHARGVHNVMVIDDSLDAGPEQWSDLLPNDRDQVWTFIDDNPDFRTWLEHEDLLPPESAGSPGAVSYLEKLKARLPDHEDLGTLWEGVIVPSIGTAKLEVQALIACLTELDLCVESSGIRDPKDPPQGVSVIFIDYTLDDSDPENLSKKSVAEINRIHGLLDESKKPIVVLMSSRTTLSPELKIKFREETGIMPGMFFGFQKDQLKGISLYLLLNEIADNWPNAVALQSFLSSVTEASQAATDAVLAMVKGLTLEDFALIQLLSLNSDGQPLAEYVLWLIGGYFRRQLEQSAIVKASQARVDRMVFEAPPRSEWGPSDAFLSAYRTAVYAYADADLSSEPYPTFDEDAKQASGNLEDLVVLHLGDVFVNDDSESPMAYVVITPECDLAFGGSRPFPRKNSVVLVPGVMVSGRPFSMSSEDGVRTELLRWKDRDWRINWCLREAETISLGGFKHAASEMKIRRAARLEFSFVAEVQHAFSSRLTRVGIPIMPPQCESHDVNVYVQDANHELRFVCGPIRNGAYLFSSPQFRRWKCIFSDHLLTELHKQFESAMSLATRMPTEEDLSRTPEVHRGPRIDGAKSRIATNRAHLQGFLEDSYGHATGMMRLKGPHDLDDLSKAVVLTHLTITNRPGISSTRSDTVLTIHLQKPSGQ